SKKQEEFEEIKKSLDFMSDEIAKISQPQNLIMNLMGEVKELKRQNVEKDEQIAFLEHRVADLEQYSRMNDVVISGLEMKPRSYAQAVTEPSITDKRDEDGGTLENQVVSFFSNKGISIDNNGIEACHPLPQKNKGVKPATVMRFTNRKHKNELLKQGRKLRGSNVYINEHLTKINAEIARRARFLRKQKKIQSTWSSNCKVYIKLNGSPEKPRQLLINFLK
uniref:L1 transposable element RRM domain-containing protein n=1 Tax=Poecilia formosa TaxID=48698 RepID=A0A096MAF3_POEFO